MTKHCLACGVAAARAIATVQAQLRLRIRRFLHGREWMIQHIIMYIRATGIRDDDVGRWTVLLKTILVVEYRKSTSGTR